MEKEISGVENKMETMPIDRLMRNMGIPIILSMMLYAFYNIVDSAFLSNMAEYGEEAINALTLAYPIQIFISAVCVGTSIGTNALASKALGQKDREKASRVAGNAIFLAILIYIAWVLFALFGVEWYIGTQTSNPVVREMGVSYLRICCLFSFGTVFYSAYEKLLQAPGRAFYSSVAQAVGSVINIVLDPILIFGAFGLPAMGVRGAACATVIGQIAACVLAFSFHWRLDKEFEKGLRWLKPSGEIIREIYAVGLPVIITQFLMSFLTFGMNLILVRVNESLVTVFGLYYKIQQFVMYAAFGLRDAITPIVSYSHGMKSSARLRDGMRYGIIYTLVITGAGMIILEIFASPLAGVFGTSEDTRQIFITATRIMAVGMFFSGVSVAIQGIFQGVNCGLQTMLIAICRQVIFVLPVAGAFVYAIRTAGAPLSLVWWTFPIAEIITVVIGAFMLKRFCKSYFLKGV
ncbi:MAG: MATE family efflux transporter [Clostridiales bacterium]|nr:MATE family efflux transporter [Clostridiales bacterium]